MINLVLAALASTSLSCAFLEASSCLASSLCRSSSISSCKLRLENQHQHPVLPSHPLMGPDNLFFLPTLIDSICLRLLPLQRHFKLSGLSSLLHHLPPLLTCAMVAVCTMLLGVIPSSPIMSLSSGWCRENHSTSPNLSWLFIGNHPTSPGCF